MAEDASSSGEEERVPFSQRSEFNDVVPVPQDDGPLPVCPINYDPEFRETMDYFRALLLRDERSARALEVTQAVIELSAANYTAWHYRRTILHALHDGDAPTWLDERTFVTDVAREHPKNYQVWYHRRCVVEHLVALATASSEDLLSEELTATAEVLAQDGKNYHAWAHRQWVLTTFQAWPQEFAFVESELEKDVRNNSAWNQRWTTLTHVNGPARSWSASLRLRELEFAQKAIARAPNNESAWNYARGLVRDVRDAAVRVPWEQWCLEKRTTWPTCAPLLAALIELVEEDLRDAAQSAEAKAAQAERVQRALDACARLAAGIDDVHAKYWRRRQHRLQHLCGMHTPAQ